MYYLCRTFGLEVGQYTSSEWMKALNILLYSIQEVMNMASYPWLIHIFT